MMDVKFTWIPTSRQMDCAHGHLDYFQKPPLGGRPNTKSSGRGTLNTYNHWFFFLLYHV